MQAHRSSPLLASKSSNLPLSPLITCLAPTPPQYRGRPGSPQDRLSLPCQSHSVPAESLMLILPYPNFSPKANHIPIQILQSHPESMELLNFKVGQPLTRGGVEYKFVQESSSSQANADGGSLRGSPSSYYWKSTNYLIVRRCFR